ncbi:MAG: hypothetical protein M3N13_06070, partial [Candidatus Eremiobacteraeota bacterium]|nr:hypothetical protein [Candidatus Eremiobacteraeota bacterium]
LFFRSEYTTHRFLFHAHPSKFSWMLALQHRLRYVAHIPFVAKTAAGPNTRGSALRIRAWMS